MAGRPLCQCKINLLSGEDERELIPICQRQNVALTPYSPLAAGRLSRLAWATDSLRSQTDAVATSKYDKTRDADSLIVERVHALSEKHGVTMSQIALAWLLHKGVSAPIIGATKAKYFDDAVGALDVSLDASDIASLEELYIPHAVVGAL